MLELEELDVWKLSRDFRNDISKLVKTFPDKEKFSLISQIIRSSRSISANIAEGFGRYHFQENIQFCRQARGSLFETLEHLTCAYDEDYITKDIYEKFRNQVYGINKVLNGYISYLKKAKENNKY